MIILQRSSGDGVTVDLIVGTGLIGDAVAQASRLLPGLLTDATVPTAWADVEALNLSLALAANSVRALHLRPDRLRVFWCAGRSGFGSTSAQCQAELRLFETVLHWAAGFAPEFSTEFHMASSAGGLHEGQMTVSSASAAHATRPYGESKLAQERALHVAPVGSRFVYRVSSAYGLPLAGRRRGLVSTLVVNALHRRPTLITAHAATQRDYISDADVGTFMASEGKRPTSGLHEGVHYLVHGRPLSVSALKLALERHLFSPVAVIYSKGKDNFESTTFSQRIRPPLWTTSSVESNLPKIIEAVQVLGRS